MKAMKRYLLGAGFLTILLGAIFSCTKNFSVPASPGHTTVTNTVSATPTSTATPTPTNTAGPTPYPSGSYCFDDFDATASWPLGYACSFSAILGGGAQGPLASLLNPWTAGSNAMSVSVVNTQYYTPGSSGTQSIQVTGTVGSPMWQLEWLFANGASGGAAVTVGTPPLGATMQLSFMVYSETAPITVANVYIWDTNAYLDHFEYTGLGAAIPVGVWTNVVVPVYYGSGVNLPAGGGGGWIENGAGFANMNWNALNVIGIDILGPIGTEVFYFDNIYLTPS